MRGSVCAFVLSLGLTVSRVGGFRRLAGANTRATGRGGGNAGQTTVQGPWGTGLRRPQVVPTGGWRQGGLPPTHFRLETDELLPITAGRRPQGRAAGELLGSGLFRTDLAGLGPLLPRHVDEEALVTFDFPSITSPTPESPPQAQDSPPNRNNNFTVNVGKALDALRLDVPLCFEKEPDLSIYTEDVRFRDDSRVYASGRFMYQMLFFSLRLARVFMPMPPIVEVINMRWCEARQCIYVRFQIRVDTLSDQLYYDAVSLYRVNAQGLIYEHILENVIRNDLMERPAVMSLFETTRQILVAPGAPAPAPENGLGC